MAYPNDLVFLSYRIGRGISEPGSNVRYEVVSPAVRVTRSPDFNAPPARFNIRVLRETPQGTVMSVYGSRNREWDGLIARVAYLIRALEAQAAPTTASTTAAAATTAATSTTSAVVAAQDAAQAAATVDAAVADIASEDEGMDEMDVKTVSRSASGAGAEGIMDKPWFWPAVAVGGVAAIMYFRRK